MTLTEHATAPKLAEPAIAHSPPAVLSAAAADPRTVIAATLARTQSTPIGALVTALAKAQAEMGEPEFDTTVDFVNTKGQRVCFRYASLASVRKATRIPLAKHGIALIQAPTVIGTRMFLFTRLSVGEQFIGSYFPVAASLDLPAQTVGGAMTYARRYSLCALLGVVGDEGEDAPGDTAPAPRPASAPIPTARRQ